MGKTYEIWTREEAENFCESVLKYAIENEGCYTLGGAAVNCGEYEEVIWYFQKKFGIEFNSIKKAKELIKERCINKGMDSKTNATMTIFNLVNNFGMVNTNSKSEQTIKAEVTMPVTKWADNTDTSNDSTEPKV